MLCHHQTNFWHHPPATRDSVALEMRFANPLVVLQKPHSAPHLADGQGTSILLRTAEEALVPGCQLVRRPGREYLHGCNARGPQAAGPRFAQLEVCHALPHPPGHLGCGPCESLQGAALCGDGPHRRCCLLGWGSWWPRARLSCVGVALLPCACLHLQDEMRSLRLCMVDMWVEPACQRIAVSMRFRQT